MAIMCRKSSVALAFALLAAGPASAGDYYGGIKGAGGVPVPAPVPVYETFRWYLRGDLALGAYSKPSAGERGMVYGAHDSIAPFGMDKGWFQNEFDTFYGGGVGAGLYLTPRLRSDITVDGRSSSEVNVIGKYAYEEYPRVPPPVPTGNTIRGTTNEHSVVHSTLALANVYYDLVDRGSFTPYIGIGAGFAVRHVDRQHHTVEAQYNPAGLPTGYTREYESRTKTSNVVGAAAATIGASYTVSTGMLIDFNYRVAWLGGADNSANIAGNASRLTIGDTVEHAVRAGLRWNVW